MVSLTQSWRTKRSSDAQDDWFGGHESEDTWRMAEEQEVRRVDANIKRCPKSWQLIMQNWNVQSLSSKKADIIVKGEFPFTVALLLSVLKRFLYFMSKQNPSDIFTPIFCRIKCIFTRVYMRHKANLTCTLYKYEGFCLLHH